MDARQTQHSLPSAGSGIESRISLNEQWTLPVRIALFLALGAFFWWISNDFSVSEPIGFDPLRYEYYARNGLPQAFSDSSSFRMVVLLEYIYRFLPNYVGYLVFIGILCFSAIRLDRFNTVYIAISSPISFYYLCQTGKDGLAIISLVCVAMIARDFKNLTLILFVSFVVGLSLFIRPAIGLLIPLTFVQFRFGTLASLLLVPIMLYAFSTVTDTYQVLNTLEGLTGDEGAGQLALILRQYTFGYDNIAIFYKVVLLISSFIFQPLVGVFKYLSGSSNFVLFEASCFGLFLLNIVRSRLPVRFLVASLPYVLIIGATSPFYHFRYLAVTYPIIYFFCISVEGYGWLPPEWGSSRESTSGSKRILA
jgi:hypothetical protein